MSVGHGKQNERHGRWRDGRSGGRRSRPNCEMTQRAQTRSSRRRSRGRRSESGGGWTLLGTNGREGSYAGGSGTLTGDWSPQSVQLAAPFGTPSLDDSFKSAAFAGLPFTDFFGPLDIDDDFAAVGAVFTGECRIIKADHVRRMVPVEVLAVERPDAGIVRDDQGQLRPDAFRTQVPDLLHQPPA